jgi:hypothetical protein
MRVRTLAGAASLAILLIGLVVAPTAQGNYGRIVVRKSINLVFPAPGFYKGTVKAGKVKVKSVATREGKRVWKAWQREAVDNARTTCNRYVRELPVEVIHLSKPPYTIGVDKKPDRAGKRAARYIVSGAKPPTGDPVLAQQHVARFKIYQARGVRWKVTCQGAKDIKPYPY